MDLSFHESLEPSKLDGDDDHEKVEPGELLEETWFFGNRKTKIMSRSFSDTASLKSIKKLTLDEPSLMMRAPSMPPCMERKDQNPMIKGSTSDPRRSKLKKNIPTMNPSLPTNMGITEDFDRDDDDEEIEFSMGKLIRQASLNRSNNLPPTAHAAKSLTPSENLSRHRSRREPELECIKMMNVKPGRLMNQLKPQKSLSDLRDLGYKNDLNPNVIPWKPHSSSPPVPKWVGKRSADDLKAHIKFWARAVASNVRQEC